MFRPEEVAASFELPPAVEQVVGRLAEEDDARFEQDLMRGGLDQPTANSLRDLASFMPHCMSVVDLVCDLRRMGMQAWPMINESAFVGEPEDLLEISTLSPLVTHHAIAQIGVGRRAYFVDPTWKQFFIKYGGPTIMDLGENYGHDVAPTERILAYQADEVDIIASWFATNVRWLQERVLRGCLRGKSNAFTRPAPDVLDQMLKSRHYVPSATFLSAVELEQKARQIWDIDNYRPMTVEEAMQTK